ncbi:MAG: four helix bundle protein, partial [Candidatus Omnitrophota bacterium]
RKELKELSRNKFPQKEQYNLTAQLWRALDSVLLNIAEGSERYSVTLIVIASERSSRSNPFFEIASSPAYGEAPRNDEVEKMGKLCCFR